jgi:hypothetical protein
LSLLKKSVGPIAIMPLFAPKLLASRAAGDASDIFSSETAHSAWAAVSVAVSVGDGLSDGLFDGELDGELDGEFDGEFDG